MNGVQIAFLVFALIMFIVVGSVVRWADYHFRRISHVVSVNADKYQDTSDNLVEKYNAVVDIVNAKAQSYLEQEDRIRNCIARMNRLLARLASYQTTIQQQWTTGPVVRPEQRDAQHTILSDNPQPSPETQPTSGVLAGADC